MNGFEGYIHATTPYTKRSSGYFQISPAGQDDTTQNAIWYTSCNYVWPTDWVTNTAYSLGNKVAGINNIYICTTAGTSGATRPSATSGTEVDGTVTWTVYNEPYPITADTDFVVLPDDLFIEGLRWAWYQAKKQDYLDLKNEWIVSVRNSLGSRNGAIQLNAGVDVTSNWQWPVTPDGNWSGTGGS